jgi:predicted amidohydrolase
LIDKFPDGQVVIKANGKVAGCALSIKVNYDNIDDQHTYKEITGNYSFDTHIDDGDILYGIDIFIKPEFRGLKLGRRLYDYKKELCEKQNLEGIVFGGSIPNSNINIISGSMPEIVDDSIYNVGYLCKRNGEIERYEKLHVTPDEIKFWGLKGGNKLRTFDTDCGKIGILICYDVEFPKLSRLLSEEGMDILFVPFLTDTQNGYSRVRFCAQARAIENECFVAIAGRVGNLPNVHNMDIQFAQSMVFTPCDFPFPTNGIKAEAMPNTEMILIADVDLLRELNEFGAVRNLKDRRKDIFNLVKFRKD